MWLRISSLVPSYLLWGTGGGTFAYVEPLTRRPDAYGSLADASG